MPESISQTTRDRLTQSLTPRLIPRSLPKSRSTVLPIQTVDGSTGLPTWGGSGEPSPAASGGTTSSREAAWSRRLDVASWPGPREFPPDIPIGTVIAEKSNPALAVGIINGPPEEIDLYSAAGSDLKSVRKRRYPCKGAGSRSHVSGFFWWEDEIVQHQPESLSGPELRAGDVVALESDPYTPIGFVQSIDYHMGGEVSIKVHSDRNFTLRSGEQVVPLRRR